MSVTFVTLGKRRACSLLGTKERPGPHDPGLHRSNCRMSTETFHCQPLWTVRETVVVFVLPPPVPVMVMV